jgi:hypothetical protein
VECLFVATTTRWTARHVVGLAGKPLSWRKMVQVCAKSIDRRRAVIPVPNLLALGGISLVNKIRATQIYAGIVQRFGENVDIPLSQMREMFAVQPREFEVGLRLAIDGWRHQGVM